MLDKNYLIELGAIYIENINEGFKCYDYRIVEMSESMVTEYVKKLMLNVNNKCFADFYYNTLECDAKARVLSVLDKEDIIYVNKLNKDSIIFELTDELLKIITLLNKKEMLFSTIYIVGEDVKTLWGNYNSEYVIFENKKCVKNF